MIGRKRVVNLVILSLVVVAVNLTWRAETPSPRHPVGIPVGGISEEIFETYGGPKGGTLDTTRPIVLQSDQIRIILQPHKGTYMFGSVENLMESDSARSLNVAVALFSVGFTSTSDQAPYILSSNDFEIENVERPRPQSLVLHMKWTDYHIAASWRCTIDKGIATVALDIQSDVAPLEVPHENSHELSHTVDFVDLFTVPTSTAHRVAGSVQGCPVVFDTVQLWFGIEHPMSNISSAWVQGQVTARMPLYGRGLDKYPVALTAAFGAYKGNQLRRTFSNYLETIRAQKWRQWLHYNSWYQLRRAERMKDVSGFRKEDEMTEENVRRVMSEFRENLIEPANIDGFRGFLLDDGWDNYDTLWEVDTKEFPNGFRSLVKYAAQSHLGSIGVWLSPWGGYEQPRVHRERYGRKQGFETNKNGFSLAGPKYFNRFLRTAADFVKNEGVTFFKFDGIAGGFVTSGPPREFVGDVFGLFELVKRLRQLKDGLFINLTVGTWPSPYLLTVADSIWRGDLDTGGWGHGSRIQRWITYRDMIVYKLVVMRSELFPISSLMLHGAVLGDVDGFAKQVLPESRLSADEIRWDWACELWSFFACGANLQELYITPRLMTKSLWSIVIDAVKFSQAHAHVLRDSHMIGGDPRVDEPYGWASYDPVSSTGVLALRNPATTAQTMTVCPERDLEIALDSVRNECVGTLVWGEVKPGVDNVDFLRGLNVLDSSRCWPEFNLPAHQLLVYSVDCGHA